MKNVWKYMNIATRVLLPTFAASLLVILLVSCEDSITEGIQEQVRLAILLDRQLTVQPSSAGQITPVGNHSVKEGEPFALTAQTNPGFNFYRWEKVSGTGTIIFENPDSKNTTVKLSGGDAIIQAVIDDTSFDVLVINDGHGSTNQTSITLTKDIASSSLTATPDPGFAFNNWTITGGSGIVFSPNATNSTVTITASAGDGTIRANFRDSQAPTGTVAIQGKQTVDATFYNKTQSVTVNLTYSDNTAVSQMKLSNTTFSAGTTTGWITPGLSTTFNFGSDGAKTLYVRFKDAAGNESGLYTDTTVIDSTGPVPSRYQVDLTNDRNRFPLYVTTYNTNLELNYLATDAGCGVQKVYFSNTTTKPPVAQVTAYPATPSPFTWSLPASGRGYYRVYFWFEDKLANVSGPFIDDVRYDDAYEGFSGNNSLDATSGASITVGNSPDGTYDFGDTVSSLTQMGESYLVDADYYKWSFNPLNSDEAYPADIIIYVNQGGVMPRVTFYNHNRLPITATRTYPYLSDNNQAKYHLVMPYISTSQQYDLYMSVDKLETAPYSSKPNYYFTWIFNVYYDGI